MDQSTPGVRIAMKWFTRNICPLILLLWMSPAMSQKMTTRAGQITFEASVPSFEPIFAVNNGASCTLNAATGDIGTAAMMKGFKFRVSLMQEHFNDNYVESHRYPKATFKGRIENFSASKLTNEPHEFRIKGKMEIHGKTKAITIPAKIRRIDNGIEITSNFTLNTADFNISIPSVVRNKVSDVVNVNCTFVVK